MEGYPRIPGQGHYQKPSNGTLILVLGILSLVICGPILGPVAWVMGNQSLREIKAGIMSPQDEGIIQAGRIIGIVATVLSALAILFYIFFFTMIAASGGFAPRR